MSWSVICVGKGAALAAKLAKDFASITCPEPEKTIKDQIAAIAAQMIAATPEAVMKVEASGSQYTVDGKAQSHTARFLVEPIYGFVE